MHVSIDHPAVGQKEVQGLAVVGQVAHPEVGQSAGGGAAHIGDGDQVQAAGGLDHCYGDRGVVLEGQGLLQVDVAVLARHGDGPVSGSHPAVRGDCGELQRANRQRAADEDAEGGIGAGRVEKADAAPTGPAGDHADAASWGHGTALSRIWERDHRSTPDIGRHRTALSGVRQGDHRGLAAGGTGLGGVGGEGFGREAVEGFHMKSRTSSAFLLSVWAALSYSGDGRGVTGVTAPFFRERGGEAGRKEHRPDLEGKDTRRGAEKRKPAAAYGQPPVFHIAGSEDWR